MRHSGWLKLVEVAEQCSRRSYRRIVAALNSKGFERADLEMLRQLVAGKLTIKLPRLTLGYHRAFFTDRSFNHEHEVLTAWKNHFARSESRQHRLNITDVRGREAEFPGREICGCNADSVTVLSQRAEVVVPGTVE